MEEVERVEKDELISAESLIEHLGIEIGDRVVVTNRDGKNTTYYLAGFTIDHRVLNRLGKKKNIRYDLRKILKDGSMGKTPMIKHSVLNPIDLINIAPYSEAE